MKKRGSDSPEVEEEKKRLDGAKSKKAVISYIIALSLVIVFFIILSHFMHLRNNRELNTLSQQMATVEELTEENRGLESAKQELESRVSGLEEELDREKAEKDRLTQELDRYKAEYGELEGNMEN